MFRSAIARAAVSFGGLVVLAAISGAGFKWL
jgi:hypothetical protein